jgi:hypothetical protein
MTSINYTFTGTTNPGIVSAGQVGTCVIAGGVLNEGTIPGTPAASTPYRGVGIYPTPVSTSIYSASVIVNSAPNAYYEPCGVAIGFDSAGGTGLMLLMCALSNYWPTIQVVTKVGSTFTVVYSDTTNSTSGLSNPVLKVAITFNGTNYVYTPSVNGTVITAAIWTDTSNVLGTPGSYFGASFQPVYTTAQYNSDGVTNLSASDTAAVVLSGNKFFSMF